MCTERLLLQIVRVSRDGEDTESVGVAQTALPALDSNDYSAGLDDVELECGDWLDCVIEKPPCRGT